ncbi:MAG: PAS domain S-box protein [Desulfobulbaceae bacterium]|nr:PAS domain S-box protein [Desulfobulbaceae bacterium]
MTESTDHESPAETIERLSRENEELRTREQAAFDYIRQKVNQLLVVTGTVPLKPEELDNDTLLHLDPIGIISDSFAQILEHMQETNIELAVARDEIQAIFDSVGGGLLVLDPDMKITSYNMKMKEIFTDTDREVIGQSCHSLLCGNPEISPKICVIKEIFSTMKSARKTWNHEGHNYEVVATPLFDDKGELSTIVVLYMDITRSVQAENALQQNEEKYRKLVTAANDAIFLIDTETGLILEVNKKGEELLGWPAEDIIGRHHSQLHSAEQNLFEGKDFADNQKDGTVSAVNMTICHKDGHTIPVEISSSLIELDNKKVMISIFRDITERKKMEEELQKAQKLESIGILAGGIAHDFNNLLTAFIGNVSLAKTHTSPGSKIYDRLTAAEDASNRAQDLTQQLLTFAKGGAPVTKTTTITKIIEETTGFFLRGANVNCEYSFLPDLLQVEVDEGQFSQVIHNLIINAEQAMPDGGTIRISAENVLISNGNPLPLPAGQYVKISLSDNGAGIPAKQLSKIFDPFFSTKQKGSGLGLATTYSIIKGHGGLITVESELGKGTTFHIYLAASHQQPEIVDETPQPLTKGAGRILIMDDEDFVREIATEMLKALGFATDSVCDGQEAIDLYKKAMNTPQSFDAVIMDLTIPGGMGGKEAIAKLLEIDPQAKVVVSSGYAHDPIMANFGAYGFCGVVPKPYRLQTLNDTMHKILGTQ